jgi:hypothetical protein
MRFVDVMQRVFEFATSRGFFVHDSPGRIINLLSDAQIAERHEGVATTGVNSIRWSFPDAAGFAWAVFCLPAEDLADALVLRVGVDNSVAFIRVGFTGEDGYSDIETELEWFAFADGVLQPVITDRLNEEEGE